VAISFLQYTIEMFSQLFTWLRLFPLQSSVEKDTVIIPSKLLQIQQKDLHAIDKNVLDIWRVREKDVIARVSSSIEIRDSITLVESVDDLIHPLEKQPHSVINRFNMFVL
jgi:hypothetical protein